MRKKIKLGEILLKATSLPQEQLKEVLYLQAKEGFSKPIGEILIEKGYVNREDVETALGVQEGYPYICVTNYEFDPDIVRKIPKDIALKFYVLALDLIEGILTVAVFSVREELLKELEKLGFKIRICLARKKEIEEVLRRYLD